MGVPKKKRSKSRIGSRKALPKLSPPSISYCPQCKSPKLPHFACPKCGYYKGKLAVVIKEKGEKKKKGD
ncbi:MAG: 50S ribosomal protein L32 [Candidatus Aerophobetes bacterium]|nr:50S ribosomal protein L32 [Candidatus Aerophobetes bacterium]